MWWSIVDLDSFTLDEDLQLKSGSTQKKNKKNKQTNKQKKQTNKQTKKKQTNKQTKKNPGDAGDWTRGLSHAKRTLYLWATSPVATRVERWHWSHIVFPSAEKVTELLSAVDQGTHRVSAQSIISP